MQRHNRLIEWLPLEGNAKILQMYSKGLEYSLVSHDYKQCHQFVWCKDFLHDVIHAALNKKSFEIFKFKFGEGNPMPCLDRTRLLLTNARDRNFSFKIPAVLDFVNQIEEQLKIKKTFVRQCVNPPECYKMAGVFMMEGSRRWIQAPPMLSLYTLLLRVGFCHTIGEHYTKTIDGVKYGEIVPYQKKDGHWLKTIEPAFQKIMRLGDRKIFYRNMQLNYPPKLKTDVIHNRLGIMGLAADMYRKGTKVPVVVPYWHSEK